MQIEALYDHGQLKFDHPLHFAKECFPVIVQIPDSQIISKANSGAFEEPSAPVTTVEVPLVEEIRQILGPLSRRRPAASVQEDRATLVEALEEKYAR